MQKYIETPASNGLPSTPPADALPFKLKFQIWTLAVTMVQPDSYLSVNINDPTTYLRAKWIAMSRVVLAHHGALLQLCVVVAVQHEPAVQSCTIMEFIKGECQEKNNDIEGLNRPWADGREVTWTTYMTLYTMKAAASCKMECGVHSWKETLDHKVIRPNL